MRGVRPLVVWLILILAVPPAAAILDLDDQAAPVADVVTPVAALVAPTQVADDDGTVCLPQPLHACNFWASRLPTGGANEVHVAVNPNDPDHVMVVGKDYSLGANGDCAGGGAYHVGSAYYVTFDGGATWNVGRIPAPYPNGGAEPSPLPNKCGSDPVAAIGEDGTAYYIILNFHYTGGRQAVIAVARSTDGGLTWPADEIRILHASPGNDKEWGTVDSEGRVHVVWTDLSSSRILYSRSNPDWTFTAPMTLAFRGSGNPAVTVGTGPADEVYVVWRSGSSILFTRSLDHGATFTTPKVAFTTNPYEAGGAPRLPFMPQLAVDDDPASPFAGRIYVTWPDRQGSIASVHMASSGDGGDTWTAPVRVDDKTDATKRSLMPNIDVAPGGRVDIGWLDERNAGTLPGLGLSFHAFAASSADGGATWSVNQQVSEVPLVASWSRHQNGQVFIGDYIGVASAPDHAWVTFPGNGPGRLLQGLEASDFERADAYVAPVAPPVTSALPVMAPVAVLHAYDAPPQVPQGSVMWSD